MRWVLGISPTHRCIHGDAEGMLAQPVGIRQTQSCIQFLANFHHFYFIIQYPVESMGSWIRQCYQYCCFIRPDVNKKLLRDHMSNDVPKLGAAYCTGYILI